MDRIREENASLQQKIENVDNPKSPSTPAEVVRKEAELEKMRKTMAQQLSEFDNMKRKLMQDLQERCERVVELEISLDEAREAVIPHLLLSQIGKE